MVLRSCSSGRRSLSCFDKEAKRKAARGCERTLTRSLSFAVAREKSGLNKIEIPDNRSFCVCACLPFKSCRLCDQGARVVKEVRAQKPAGGVNPLWRELALVSLWAAFA